MGRGRLFVNFFGAFSVVAAAAIPTRAHAAAGEPGMSVSAPSVPGAHERFLVVPFTNMPDRPGANRQHSLDFLQAALPALIAERLPIHPELRFAGSPSLVERGRLDEVVARAAAGGARFVVAGSFARQPGWKIEVTVAIYDKGLKVVERTEAGGRDDVSRTALVAALDAFAAAGVPTPGDARAAITAPFSRDPYAFVLYGRGVAAALGLDDHPGSGERALAGLSRALVIDPNVPETRRYAGFIHMQEGRPGHARAMWSTAVDERPTYAAALLELAELDRTQGLPTARERYGRVLELDPDNFEARRAYGELLSEAGQLDEAQAELEQVVAVSPGDLRARRTLALVLAGRRAGGELATELAAIVRLDPEDLDARLELGAAYAAVGKVDASLEAYEEVLRRRPRHTAALKIAADLYRTKGEPAKAAAYYERLRRLAPEDPRPVFLLGASYYDAGRLDAAERMFTEGARFPGMLGDAYSNLGAISYRRGRYKEAIWFLSRAAQRRPGKAGVRYNYALALQAVERYEDALKELDAAAVAAPGDAEVRFLSGVVSLRMARLDAAAAFFQEALRLDPAHENARYNLALLESMRANGETSIR
jgi:tetratricopeptide (TPR) repeat protein